LRIRDGEPVDASIRAAVDGDSRLRAELADLVATRRELRALPTLSPPSAAWPRIAERLAQQERTSLPVSRPASRHWPLRAAIAAGVAVAAVWLVERVPDAPLQDTEAPATIVADQTSPRGPLLGTPAYASLVAESARLERALDSLDGPPRVVRVGTAATIADLEDRIAWIDDRLTFARALGLSAEQTQSLYRQRVELLHALVQVRYADARRFTF
jgi:hypothetical protein